MSVLGFQVEGLTFDEFARLLRDKGFGMSIQSLGAELWRLDLRCGVEMLEASIPRPYGTGSTVLEALTNAALQIKDLKGLKIG